MDSYQDIHTISKFKSFFLEDNYNNVMNNIMNHQVSKIYIDSNFKELVSIDNLPNGDNVAYSHFHLSTINPVVIPTIIEKTSENHVPIYFVNLASNNVDLLQKTVGGFFDFLVNYTLPFILIVSFLPLFTTMFFNGQNRQNRQNRQNMNPMNSMNPLNSFMSSFQKKDINTLKLNVSLSDWAGSPEVIEECNEIISYIDNKERFKMIGAEMPKGILLEGPPGTGKTLLAKAIATETNSTFISISASEFVEVFVGIGASRVRELFDSARKNKPSIIFIDEIDAIGRQRGAGINMANDEREQTLNQLLYEMDGFNNNDDVVVMAATNRKDVLDQALLRPGRFDRIILVPLPDKFSREKILEYYLNEKPLEKPFDISSISELTEGFSGAQLKNLINEAAILSAKKNYTVIQEQYMFDAFEKLIVGLIRKNAIITPLMQERVSIHESGHALLVLAFSCYFDLKKVSIQSTYSGAGGYTLFSEKPQYKEGGLFTKDILKKRLIIAMGGKAAESIYYGNEFVSSGAIQDLKQANQLARKMIGNYGMGDDLEVFFNEDIQEESNPFLGKSLGIGNKYSENTQSVMDKESLDLVREAYKEAKEILKRNPEKLATFQSLLQKNTVVSPKDVPFSM
jgi:cell division protease FtsH